MLCSFSHLIHICLVACLFLSIRATPLAPSVQIHNAPGASTQDTYLAIRRGLAAASLEKRQSFRDEIPLARSWDGATLLSVQFQTDIPQNNEKKSLELIAGIEVTCTTCYVRGLAIAELTISDDFNVTEQVNATMTSVLSNVNNFTETFSDYLDNYADQVVRNFADGIDFSDFDFPTFPYAFNLTVPELPESNLRFTFNELELYMQVNTVLSAAATYEINLYTTQSAVGISVGPALTLGLTLQIDLILAIDGEIDISSGLHMKLDDGLAMDIALFGDKVTNMIFQKVDMPGSNGGQFEFLPITVESGGVVISAVLRIGAHCGIESPSSPTSPSS
ncbi:hypothetical protein OPT61_g7188 [Boeremia exigua]|uniref:Uncharacterized protein n=1 Tax=Boeremia exigua TaxID=749465 RepID=A0ACC2I388_9PLEO|nr:hypothetical protein OPT61_g7188 [Boeremia exigua]